MIFEASEDSLGFVDIAAGSRQSPGRGSETLSLWLAGEVPTRLLGTVLLPC